MRRVQLILEKEFEFVAVPANGKYAVMMYHSPAPKHSICRWMYADTVGEASNLDQAMRIAEEQVEKEREALKAEPREEEVKPPSVKHYDIGRFRISAFRYPASCQALAHEQFAVQVLLTGGAGAGFYLIGRGPSSLKAAEALLEQVALAVSFIMKQKGN